MSNWVNSDVCFDAPSICLCVPAREAMLSFDLRQALRSGDAAAVEREVVALILEARPELVGMVIYSMHFEPTHMMWRFVVLHPSLPRVRFGEREQREWLKKCPACGRGIDAESKLWLRELELGRTEVVCSEACVTSEAVADVAAITKRCHRSMYNGCTVRECRLPSGHEGRCSPYTS